jgi:GGDEF domain-containing protein
VYGPRVGDRVLDSLAERLASLADTRTLIGRFRGDDFMVVAQREDRTAAPRSARRPHRWCASVPSGPPKR